jgi:hypothetical protein
MRQREEKKMSEIPTAATPGRALAARGRSQAFLLSQQGGLSMEKRFDVGAVMTDLTLTKASLEVLEHIWQSAEMGTEDRMLAASVITLDAVRRAVQDIEGVMGELKALEA